MKVFLIGVSLVLCLSSAILAQSASRVAMIDSSRLDKAGGVTRLHDALRVVESSDPCHHRCYKMKQAIEVLEKEIAYLKSENQPLGDREAKLNESKGEYDKMLAFAKERFKTNTDQFVKPVIDDMLELAQRFATERSYLAIVDKLGLVFPSSVIAGQENVPDVTSEFISYCNTEFERRRNETRK